MVNRMQRERRPGRTARVLSVLGLVVLLASCDTTRNSFFGKLDALVAQKNYAQALKDLEGTDGQSHYGDKDQVLRYLDLGTLQHMAGRYDDSNRNLAEAERLIEEYFTKSVLSAAASLIGNDNAIEYSGEPYEDLYLNVIMSLNYAALDDFDNAYVEVQRVNNKLNLLEDKYRKLAAGLNSSPDARGAVKAGKTEFYNSALAHWLSAVLYRADGQPDNAAIDLAKIDEAFREEGRIYNFPKPGLAAFLEGGSQARVNLIALVGRGPYKKAHTYRMNTVKDMILVSMEDEDAKGRLRLKALAGIPFPGLEAGLNFKCQVPYVATEPSQVRRVTVLVDGVQAGSLALIEDINRVAEETFKLREGIVYSKTIVRTVVKGVTAKLAKDAVRKQTDDGSMGSQLLNAVLGLAADAVVDASEQADLRGGRFYPGQAWVGDLDVAPGQHNLTVQYFNAAGKLLYSDELGTRRIDQKGLNLWASWSPL